MRAQFGEAMLYLFGVAGVVLLIACVNLASFALARFIDRHHELGVRRALGASRWDIARALVTENVILITVGAVLGGLIAAAAASYLVPYLTTSDFRQLPAYLDVSPDWRVLGLITLLALTGAFVSGLIPAMRASKLSALSGLSAAVRTATRAPSAMRFVRVLLVGQVAFSLVLLASAALLVRSFVELSTQDVGFERERVIIVTVTGNLGSERAAQFQTIDEIRRRLEMLPDVEVASASLVTPVSGQRAMIFLSVPGFEALEPGDSRPLANRVSPGHFRVYGTPLLTGRDFDDRDSFDAPAVAIVNRRFAERYFNGQDPVGRTIVLNKRETTIVGMAGNAKQLTLRDPAQPFVYAPMSQWAVRDLGSVRFGLRTRNGTPSQGTIAAAFQAVNPVWTLEIRSLADDVRRSINVERLLAWCGGAFSLLAVAIAIIGTYGVFAYGVSRRQQEIGVRMALGATPGSIGRLVMDDALIVMAAGVTLGFAGTWAVGRVVERFLFQISSHDPVTLAAATVMMVCAAVTAAVIPARRAAHVDPLVALRYE